MPAAAQPMAAAASPPPTFSLSLHVVFRPIPWWLAHPCQLNGGRRRPPRRPACLHSLQHPRPLLFYVAADSYRPLRNALSFTIWAWCEGSQMAAATGTHPRLRRRPCAPCAVLAPTPPFPNLWLGPPLPFDRILSSQPPPNAPLVRGHVFGRGPLRCPDPSAVFHRGAPASLWRLWRPCCSTRPPRPIATALGPPLPHPSLHPLPPSPASLPASLLYARSLSPCHLYTPFSATTLEPGGHKGIGRAHV